MKLDARELAAALAPGLLLAAVLAGAASLVAATLEPAERATLVTLLEPRLALVVMLWFVVAIGAGVALHLEDSVTENEELGKLLAQ